MKTFYEMLGVEKDANSEEIKKAYDKKIFKTDEIEEAYETLITPEQRTKYDEQLEKERQKSYYELLNIDKTATTQDIFDAYYKISSKDRTEEITKAFNILSNPTKRTNYNIKLGNQKLKIEESKAFKKMVTTKLDSKYDNYSREIYISKYQNKIDFIKKQIEIIQNEKDKNSFSYKIRISNLVTELEQAQKQMNKWMWGKGTIAGQEVTHKFGKIVLRPLEGKGLEKDLVSKIISKSIEQIETNEEKLKENDVTPIEHIKLNIKSGFWKNVKKVSSGAIKLYATTWSKVQDIVMIRPNYIKALKETEQELEERITRVVR